MTDKKALRRHLKRVRSTLSAPERAAAGKAAMRLVLRLPQFRRARRIAGFVGTRGELDPMPLLEQADVLHKACYLPVLHPFQAGRLWFCRWRPGDRLLLNRYGIPEPAPGSNRLLPARRLDLIIVPLLGFDAQGHRLGMGGGYYDRSLAFVHRLQSARRPFLLGFAHDAQRVDRLDVQPWDVSLDAVVTNLGLYRR